MRTIDPHCHKIGQFLAIRRQKLGLTQAALATKSGVNVQQLLHQEKGYTWLSVGRLTKLASALHLTLDDLFACRESTVPVECPHCNGCGWIYPTPPTNPPPAP